MIILWLPIAHLISHVDFSQTPLEQEGQPAVDNLNEMQCMWFLTESARIYFKNQDWANVLQKCHEVSYVNYELIGSDLLKLACSQDFHFSLNDREINKDPRNMNGRTCSIVQN